MTTLNLDESHDFDSERYLLATEIADLMTKQFNSKELSDILPYLQTGGTRRTLEEVENEAAKRAKKKMQRQAAREARQAAREEELEPLRRLQLLQSGVGTVISGYPQRDTFITQPDPSPLATALGVGSTLAGIYGALNPRPLFPRL